jgi:hypothetical protein
MGRLHEQAIPTIFNGVSRQPDAVRFPGQVQDAENVEFSVETGGFGKRSGFRVLKKLTGLSTGETRRLHTINRDADEKYALVLSQGQINIYDQDGTEKTVNTDAAGDAWLDADPYDFAMMTAVDFTFMVKKTETVVMDSGNLSPAAPSDAVVFVNQQAPDNSTWTVTINSTEVANFSASAGQDSETIAAGLYADLIAAPSLASGWTINQQGSYIFIRKNDGTDFTITQSSVNGDSGIDIYKGFVSSTTDAPARARHGMILNVRGVTGDGFWIKFEANDGSYGDGAWRETVEPGTEVAFDVETMPWTLIRESNGEFTLQTADWDNKEVGDAEAVPNPDFVDNQINDITFHRNRLGLVSGETVYFSRAGDYFNFWPETSTEVNDADPFGLTNTTRSISKFYFAVPFRRSIFVMADNAQFEISGELLTPTRAVIDLATSYAASTMCRPVAVGDELYFPAETETVSELLAYAYDEQSVSETADSVTKHVPNFIPAPVREIVGDPISGQIFLRTDGDPDALYVHRFFYQGNERVQSAWGRYRFPGMNILSIGQLGSVVIILYEYDGAVWLGELPIQREETENYDWTPRIDHQQMLTGTYDSGTDTTTWDLGYQPTSPVAVVSTEFDEEDHMRPLSLTIDGTEVSAAGDWSAHPVMIGENFDAFVVMSKQYVRDEQGTSIVGGRLQLRYMLLRYSDTGYFKVEVTPEGRDPQVWHYTDPVAVGPSGTLQQFQLRTGKFRFGVRTNGETGQIKISSDKPMPFNITSAAWVGFFNEISRQG